MSYRNPQIIVDRSSEIYAQGFAKLGQQAAGMINKYNEQKRLEQERIKKKNDAFKLLQNEVSFKAYQDADKVYSKIKGNSLLEQFQDQYTNMLEGDGENEGAIKAQTILKTRGSDLSVDERKRLNKIVSDANAYKDLMINSGGAIQNDINQYKEKITAENIQGDYVWKGDTDEDRFNNMLAMFSLSNQEVPGVESKKELKRVDGVNVISITNKINTKDPDFMKKMDALDLRNNFEVDENGYANVTWEMPIEKYGDGLIVETPSAIDKVKTLETAQLVKNGQPVPGLVQQQSNVVTSYLNGKEVTSIRQYLDSEKIKDNKTLRSEYEAHAKGILTTSLSEQKAYMEQRLGKVISLKDWKDITPEDKTEQIVTALEANTIDDLGFGSFVPKAADDADVKFYKEQLGKTIVKGEEIYVKTNEKFSDIKQPSEQTQTTDYDDVASIAQTIKSGNYQDISFPGTVISIEKSDSVAKKGQNIVSVNLEVGSSAEPREFDLNNKTSLYSLAEEIFKGSSKEIRSKRSEFVKQMLSKNKASASDNKEPTGSEDDPLIYKPQN
jgi:hypothetical protein